MDLAEYYSDDDHDFICSPVGSEGMTKCFNLPPFSDHLMTCNRSASAASDNAPANGSCVDWHVYYTDCRPSQHNPFHGAISFDNIGLAWVAIFQVSATWLSAAAAVELIISQFPAQILPCSVSPNLSQFHFFAKSRSVEKNTTFPAV